MADAGDRLLIACNKGRSTRDESLQTVTKCGRTSLDDEFF